MGDNEQEVFLGHSVTQQKHVSDATARLIDEEVRRLIDGAEDTARRILSEKREDLERVAAALLEYETLSGEEVRALLRGEPVVRADPRDEPRDAGRRASVPSSGKKVGKEPRGGFEAEPQPNR